MVLQVLGVSLMKGRVELIDLPRPVVEHPADAILLVTTSVIGPWEIDAARCQRAMEVVPGVQFAGTVVELGKAVTSVDIDDLVVARCAVQSDNVTVRFGSAELPGGQAEYVRVPEADSALVKTTAAAEERSVFAGGSAALGIAAAQQASEHTGDAPTLFLGCDATALSSLAWLRRNGDANRDRHLALDTHEARLAAAKSYGAKPVEVNDLGRTEIGAVVVGSTVETELVMRVADRLPGEKPWIVSNPDRRKSELAIASSIKRMDWPTREQVKRTEMAIRLRQIDLTPLVSTVLPLDEAEEAYRIALDAPAGARSVLLKP